MTDERVAPPPGGETAYEPDPRRWRILGVSLVIAFMALLDVTIVNVALPSIRAGLDTSNATVQWVVSGYALAFGLTLVAGGRLGDAYGRRRLMLIGLAGFVVSSAAVGLAPTIGLVIVARLVQGASAGLLTPQNSGLVQQLFRGAERGRAFGMFGLTVRHLVGDRPGAGWPDHRAGRRGERLALAVPGQRADRPGGPGRDPAPRPASTAPARRGPRQARRSGCAAARLPVCSPCCSPWSASRAGSPPVVLTVLASPVLLVAFLRWEARLSRRGEQPLLDVTLLRGLPGYASGLAVGSIYFTGFTGIFLVLSVHLQEGLDFSPLQAGLLLTPFAIGAAATAPVAGRLVSRIHRRITVIALSVMMAGTLGAALLVPALDPDVLWMALVPTMLVAGIGGGGVISPNFTLTLAEVPPRMGGAAGGAIQTGQRIGSAIGAALLMTVYHVTAEATSPANGLRIALLTAIGVLALALAMAVRDLRLTNRN